MSIRHLQHALLSDIRKHPGADTEMIFADWLEDYAAELRAEGCQNAEYGARAAEAAAELMRLQYTHSFPEPKDGESLDPDSLKNLRARIESLTPLALQHYYPDGNIPEKVYFEGGLPQVTPVEASAPPCVLPRWIRTAILSGTLASSILLGGASVLSNPRPENIPAAATHSSPPEKMPCNPPLPLGKGKQQSEPFLRLFHQFSLRLPPSAPAERLLERLSLRLQQECEIELPPENVTIRTIRPHCAACKERKD